MKNLFGILFTSLLLISSLGLESCKKKTFDSDGNLDFSQDTVIFDTVFTTIGSTTQQFKIYNRDNKKITISEIQLVGGSASKYRINLDGLQGTSFQNIEIEGGDSLFCFVEVTLDVNGQNLPLVVEDSIRFKTNGEDQYVLLAAWGQDMYYHYSNFQTQVFDLNEGTWANDKPHLIYGAAFVDSAKTLNIVGGTNIFLHKNSILYNYKGTLNIDGDYNNKVTLQGDRLESFYDEVPGQYYGIYFQEALPSTIDNCVIKNATAGIHVFSRDQGNAGTTVAISNTEIINAASYGVFLFDGPKVTGENVLVHSSSVHALLVLKGAEFTFTHCNFLGYGSGEGTTPAVGIRNYYTNIDGLTELGDIPVGNFRNCVIYGSTENQLVFDTIQTGGEQLNFAFQNCLIKAPSSSNSMFSTSNFNGNPAFLNPSEDDYTFTNASSALNNTGNAAFVTSTGTDLLNMPRLGPDIGVFELN